MSWLLGGPFLELSFIIEEVNQLDETIQQIQNTNVKIEVHTPSELIMEFYEGYPYDEDDPGGKLIHQVKVNLTVHTLRKRNAILFIERIGPGLLCFTMCFFGDKMDVPEWNQPGVRHEELPEFIGLLVSLYRVINFVVGGLAIEEDVKALFNTKEEWPHDDYKVSNLLGEHIENTLNSFISVLVNNCLNVQVKGIQGKQIENSGTLFGNTQ